MSVWTMTEITHPPMPMDYDKAKAELVRLRALVCKTDAERELFDWAADPVLEFVTSEDADGTLTEDLLYRFEEQLPSMDPHDDESPMWREHVKIAQRLARRIRAAGNA
jgi:hypothetical protein